MINLKQLVATMLLLSASIFSSASTINITNIAADWSSAALIDGTAPILIDTDGEVGNEEMRWGTPASGSGKSGYRFDSATTPLSTTTNVDFVLGNFTHFNFPIYPPSLSHAQLNVHLNFDVDGSSLDKTFKFYFSHNETTNTGADCCNDLVTVSNLLNNSVFNIGSDTYTLGIAGFLQNGIPVSTFSTIEGKVNSAQLVGRFAVSHAVAEPSSLMLLLLGLMGVFGLRRKSV